MSKRKTQEKFENEVKAITNGEYKVIGKYIDAKSKIEIMHINCQTISKISPENFLRSNIRCHMCTKIQKHNNITLKSKTKFLENVYKKYADEFEIIGEYEGNNTPILAKHKCGYTWNIIPSSFLRGINCPKCSNNYTKKSTEDFKYQISNLVRDEYEVLGEYINAFTKIKLKHNICGFEYSITPNSFLQGSRCRKCAGKEKGKKYLKTHEQFCKEVYDLVGNEYTIIGTYINGRTKIRMKHNTNCNYIFEILPGNFLFGQRCPMCNKSKGENYIVQYLLKYNITFVQQKKFNGLIGTGGGNLSYDFYLPDYNILIEYQGEFHDGTSKMQTKNKLKKQQEHDKRKKLYAIKNNINLLEIWYWDFDNIEKILDREVRFISVR